MKLNASESQQASRTLLQNTSPLWVKENLNEDIASFVMKNSTDGVFDPIIPHWIKKKMDSEAGTTGQMINLAKNKAAAASSNVDLVGDMSLFAILAMLHPGTFGADIHTIVLFVWGILLCLPVLFSIPTFLKTKMSRNRKLMLCPLIPFSPLINQMHTFYLMCRKAICEYQLDRLTMPGKSDEELWKNISAKAEDVKEKREELEMLKKLVKKKKLVETTVEAQPQV